MRSCIVTDEDKRQKAVWEGQYTMLRRDDEMAKCSRIATERFPTAATRIIHKVAYVDDEQGSKTSWNGLKVDGSTAT